MTKEMEKLHQAHRRFLFDHSPVDRVIEDRGISEFRGKVESEFVTSAGGDVGLYRVEGWKQPFSLYQK